MSILMVGGIILIVGFLTVMHRWQSHFARQLSLDRCVGQVTQEVRNSLRAVERSNQRMVELRVGIVAASILPELRPPLEIALKGEALKQKLRMAEWRVNSARWRLVESCRLRHVRRSAYPEWPWIEEDPDLIGERPYKWNEQYQKRAEMQVGWKGLYSGAELYRHETNTWHSRWKNVLQTTPSGWADHH